MILYKEETGHIVEACKHVYSELGNGFLEAVYQEALAIEFGLRHLPFEKEKKLKIFYKGNCLKQEYIADFYCYDKIIVELKAVSSILNVHKAQVINYLRATKTEVGILVNFGHNSFSWDRITAFTTFK